MSSGMKDWKYYNHAMIPTTPPHETPDTSYIENGEIWKHPRKPLMAQWSSNFDCPEETDWWYIIKDEPFDVSSLKSKRRYEITKGNKFFEIHDINPCDYVDELFIVYREALTSYSQGKVKRLDKNHFANVVSSWKFYKIYGAFYKETGELCGYALLKKNGVYIDFTSLKTIPKFEKCGVNAALVSKILLDHTVFLSNGGYICDGSRNINHETAFQNYLEKYFKFRKAYCKLHIKYRPGVTFIINVAYFLRKVLLQFDKYHFIHLVNSVLKMEEISRNDA